MQNISKLKTTLIAALCVTMTCGTISAQDTDLSAQRKEALQFLPVNGEKIDHDGIIINPTPHKITLRQNNGALDVSAGISIDDKKHKFSFANTETKKRKEKEIKKICKKFQNKVLQC